MESGSFSKGFCKLITLRAKFVYRHIWNGEPHMGHILFICGVEHLLRAVQSPLLPSLQYLRTHSGVRAVGRVRTHRSLATSWGGACSHPKRQR